MIPTEPAANQVLTSVRRPQDAAPVDLVLRGGLVAEVRPAADSDAPVRAVWPAFVDAHCHILPTGLDLLKLNLGNCTTRDEVLDAVRDAARDREPGAWLHAVHYDQNRFPDGRHLSRAELDAVVADRPVLLRHVNGHASVANSAALAAAGVDEATPDPPGGAYGRGPDGRLDGLLLEHAHEHVTNAAPAPDLEEMVAAILRAGESMAGYGIAAATDMMTGRWDLARELEAYRLAAARGCRVRLRLFVQWGTVFGRRGIGDEAFRALLAGFPEGRVRAVGVKIFADGAIGSATAAIYGAYRSETGGEGRLIYPRERLNEMVRTAHDAGWPIAIHAIGDRAVDAVFDAYAATGEPARHRIEHAMLLSDAQIERMRALGLHCTMQPEFLLRFGHTYRRQLGDDRAYGLKRLASIERAGIPFSLNSDRPIVSGDPWIGMGAAIRRPNGFDPAENLAPEPARRAYAEGGHAANGDVGQGTLEPGTWGQVLVFAPGADPFADGARPETVLGL